MKNLFPLITMCLYLFATIVQVLGLKERMSHAKGWMFILGVIALTFHGLLLYGWIDASTGQNLTALNMFSLLVWLVSILVLVAALVRSIEALVLFVFPLAALSVLLAMLFPASFIINTATNPEALFHIVLSVITFSVLCLAGLLALLLFFEERFLRYKRAAWLIQKAPPLQTLETLLFQAIALGVVLLGIVVVTSLYMYQNIIMYNPVLLQKTILAIMAWVVFGILLLGRMQWGWRGNKVIYGTLCGVILLFVAYFGSKLVLEAFH